MKMSGDKKWLYFREIYYGKLPNCEDELIIGIEGIWSCQTSY